MSLTPDQFLARTAFLRFQSALVNLEESMKPIKGDMSMHCRFEFQCLNKIARSFFKMANDEIFSKADVVEHVTSNERSG